MRTRRLVALVAWVSAAVGLLGGAPSAQASASDPLFVFVPRPSTAPVPPKPPPLGFLEDPCGLGVDGAGNFYVSDYYHDAVDAYEPNANYASKEATGATGYLGQLGVVDSQDGPCGLALNAANDLYVNDYHRAVIAYGAIGSFGAGTAITWAELDGTHPTGVATDPATGRVYVDERTYVGVYEEGGAPVQEGGQPLRIGEGSLSDGYGIAYSSYSGTAGYLYLPDAATNTVKVYDTTAVDKEHPVAVLGGSNTPNGRFVSLRDAAVAVDRVTGEVYLLDDLQPTYTEKPQAIVYAFSSTGAYEGHLKYLVTDGWPSGLAVDNSAQASQGRVYVTSGNTSYGTIYAYGPGAATTAPFKLSTANLSLAATGTGAGVIGSSLAQSSCTASCEEEVPAGATVALSAQPAQGSSFAGWAGACSGTAPSCEVRVEESAAVRASFAPAPTEGAGISGGAEEAIASPSAPQPPQMRGFIRRQRKHHHRRHRHAKGRHHR